MDRSHPDTTAPRYTKLSNPSACSAIHVARGNDSTQSVPFCFDRRKGSVPRQSRPRTMLLVLECEVFFNLFEFFSGMLGGGFEGEAIGRCIIFIGKFFVGIRLLGVMLAPVCF